MKESVGYHPSIREIRHIVDIAMEGTWAAVEGRILVEELDRLEAELRASRRVVELAKTVREYQRGIIPNDIAGHGPMGSFTEQEAFEGDLDHAISLLNAKGSGE